MPRKYIALLLLILLSVIAGLKFNAHHQKQMLIQQPNSTYVALGDSVAAGIGLATYSDSSACDRTNQSYPDLVATKLNLKLVSLACSGATVSTGVLGKQDVNSLMIAPQIVKLYALPKPKLISITIGANDIDWTGFITQCYKSGCGSDADSVSIAAKIVAMQSNLSVTLSSIQSHYISSTPHVLVTGYHQVFPSAGATCPDLTGLTSSDLAWGRAQQQALNIAIQSITAQYSFAKFVPINFTGHELCTPDSWVQGLSDTAPYHPTAAGQQAFAKQIVSVYQTFK